MCSELSGCTGRLCCVHKGIEATPWSSRNGTFLQIFLQQSTASDTYDENVKVWSVLDDRCRIGYEKILLVSWYCSACGFTGAQARKVNIPYNKCDQRNEKSSQYNWLSHCENWGQRCRPESRTSRGKSHCFYCHLGGTPNE